jgi:hypothetical protein
MAKKKDWDWRLFELPVEELEMFLKSERDNDDIIDLDNSRDQGGNHVGRS